MTGSGLADAQVPPPGPTADRPSPYDRDGLWPSRIVVDGLLTQGLAYEERRAEAPGSDACDDGPASRWRLGSVERSRLRLRSVHDLDHGWQVAVLLDSTLQPDRGAWGSACGRNYDAASTLGATHARYGTWLFGRTQQPAHRLVELADPWSAGGVATALLSAYGRRIDTRSDGAVTYYSPPDRPLQAALHLGRQAEGDHHTGASLVWDRLPWLFGAGWQRRAQGGSVTPYVVAHDSGWTRLSLGYVRGRSPVAQWQHAAVGLVTRRPYLGNPVGVEWRLALGRHEVRRAEVPAGPIATDPADAAGDDETKLSAGLRWQFARSAWISASAAHRRSAAACPNGRSCPAFEVGLGWAFERDLSRSGTRASIPWQPVQEGP